MWITWALLYVVNVNRQVLSALDLLLYLPALVMIISVPMSWKRFHRSAHCSSTWISSIEAAGFRSTGLPSEQDDLSAITSPSEPGLASQSAHRTTTYQHCFKTKEVKIRRKVAYTRLPAVTISMLRMNSDIIPWREMKVNICVLNWQQVSFCV